MPRISKRVVDAAKPGAKRAYTWDSTLPGFALLTLPTGVRSYIYQYRAAGRSRRATIGKHGEITPEQARALAQDMAHKVRAGRDPLADRQAARDALTVADLLDRYVASAHYATKAASTQATGKGQIERHLKPLLGRRHVASLTQDDIRRAFAAIRDGETAKRVKTGPRGLARVRGGEGAARYACRLLRAAFGWAVAERLIERNPTSGVDLGRDGAREAMLDADGYARMFAALAKLESEHRVRPAAADAIRVIALTGARKGEIIGLRWKHVESGRIVLQHHKTARATGKPRIISLPSTAQEIIARQPAGAPDDLVFGASKDGAVLSLAKAWDAVRRDAGLPDGFGLHGLRHSLASSLAIDGAGAPEIMATLGHRQLSTVARYLHFGDSARNALAERAAATALAGMRTGRVGWRHLPTFPEPAPLEGDPWLRCIGAGSGSCSKRRCPSSAPRRWLALKRTAFESVN